MPRGREPGASDRGEGGVGHRGPCASANPPPGRLARDGAGELSAADELGPVTPRTFDPPPGWTPDGHRPKAPLTYSRGPDRTWVYGGLRIGDGQAVTYCAPSRNSAHWQEFLARLERANPIGTIAVITDNLSSHRSLATRAWLAGHLRLEQVFIPKGACWLNLQEAWWRIFRRHALAGQTFADSGEIA